VRTSLVIGATGNQGGAVVDSLLRRGATVHGLVRDVRSPRAQALAARGVELVAGDLADTKGLARAMSGAAVTYGLTASGPNEVELGLSIVRAAEQARAPHLVLASVASAHATMSVPHFVSKAQIERAAQEIGIPVTVIAPTWFFENVLAQRTAIASGELALPLHLDRPLQCVALKDLGELAATVMLTAPRWAWRRIELAGDELTPAQMAAALSAAVGRPVHAVRVPLEGLSSEDLAAMYRFLEESGYAVDLPALRALAPDIPWQSFSAWAREQSWNGE